MSFAGRRQHDLNRRPGKRRDRGKHFWMALALAAGLTLRLWFIADAARIAGDTLVYGAIAKNWMGQGIYGFSTVAGTVRPTLIRLPGYPLFLAASFRIFGVENYKAVLYLQTAADLLTCLLVAALAGRLLGRRAQLAAIWLCCLCPFTANYVAAPLTETLSIFTVALALYSLERWRAAGARLDSWVWILGATLGYAILLRPDQALVAVAVVPAMVWIVYRGRGNAGGPALARWIPVVLVCILTVAPLGPWAIRNWRTFHVFEPLAPRYATDPGETVPLGFQRWYRTWAIDFISTDNAYWNYDGAPVETTDLPGRAFDDREQYIRTEALLTEYNETSNATPEFDRRFNALAQERIRANPLRYYVALPLARLADMWVRPRTEAMAVPLAWWAWRQQPAKSAFAAVYAGLDVALLVLAVRGFWLWRRRSRRASLELRVAAWAGVAFVVLRCALLATLDNSEPRYTLECFPVILLFAAAVFGQGTQAEESPAE